MYRVPIEMPIVMVEVAMMITMIVKIRKDEVVVISVEDDDKVGGG